MAVAKSLAADHDPRSAGLCQQIRIFAGLSVHDLLRHPDRHRRSHGGLRPRLVADQRRRPVFPQRSPVGDAGFRAVHHPALDYSVLHLRV